MTMTLLEIAKELGNKFYLKGVVDDKVFVNTPKDNSDDWKMITFKIKMAAGKYPKIHNCIGWSNKKNGTTFADDNADLAVGEEVAVSGVECKLNEFTKQGLKVQEPQYTVTEMVRLGIPPVQGEQPASDGVDLDGDDDTGDTFL